MRCLTGSSPGFRRLLPRAGLACLGLLVSAASGLAAMPDYLRTALRNFSPEVSPRWAYTLTTVRNGKESTTARFDPAKPGAEQWTLLQLNGSPPTPEAAAQYARARAGGGNGATPPGVFQKSDIEPASVELLREDEERGEFRCTFRAEATGSDKMLGHLALRLTVNKRSRYVEKFILELTAPYSPVLGVKMRELRVEMSFTAPGIDGPGLPAASTSHFVGRIFLFGVEEDLALTYSDFAKRE